MTRGIFISYRRSDSSGYAGRIFDRLAASFPREQVFMDVDNIELGVDFVEVLGERVGSCDALLAIIGPGWLEARNESGQRRLDDPHDFVRIEIEAALTRNTRVIPILVDGAELPPADELPEALKRLVRRNGMAISHPRFSTDTEVLIRALRRIVEARHEGAGIKEAPTAESKPLEEGTAQAAGAAIRIPSEAPTAGRPPAGVAKPEPARSAPSPTQDARTDAASAPPPRPWAGKAPGSPEVAAPRAMEGASPRGDAIKFAAIGLCLGFLFTLARMAGLSLTSGRIAFLLPQDLILPLTVALPMLRRQARFVPKLCVLAGIFYAIRMLAFLLGSAVLSAGVPFLFVISNLSLCLYLLACDRILDLRSDKRIYLLALPIALANLALGYVAGGGLATYSFTPALLGGFVAYHLARRGLPASAPLKPAVLRPGMSSAGPAAGEADRWETFRYERGLRILGDVVLVLVLWFVSAFALTVGMHTLGVQPTSVPTLTIPAILAGCVYLIIIRGRRTRRPGRPASGG